ncbi:MAG: type I restriction endonuclease subunit R, partial [Candidatus Sericytochromatia bacterium]|nr:type I restriction endonuclease subunit R [Candidatus Sericytochromatia bacterium]
MKYTEANFQEGRIVGFFTQSLNWKEGLREEIDKERFIIPSDVAWFLKEGNISNKKSFNNLIKSYGTDEKLVEAFINEALIPKITSSVNAAFILKQQISFKGQIFTLFNEPNIVGAGSDADESFDKNVFKVIQEAIFERKFDNISKRLNRKPDLTFFINGIYFSYSELKLSTQGQSASNQGREKVAHNFIEAVTYSIESVIAEEGYTLDSMPSWSDISSRASIYNKILQNVVLFSKPVHITTIDDSKLYIINDIAKFIPEIYDAVKQGLKSSSAIRLLKEFLPEKIKNDFQKMPELREQTSTQSVMTHLTSLYHKQDGIYCEVEYFNSNNRDNKLVRPRSAQRAMFFSTKQKVKSIYLDELTPKLSPEKVKEELLKSLPNIAESELALEIKEILRYKNGQDQHSILLQGAAGLGKTNLIVWFAYDLASMYHPAKLIGLKPVQENLFDLIIILTDRTELRANISKDATKAIAVEAKTTQQLVESVKNGSRIIIYNIQKIAGLKKALSQELKEELGTKRIVFIIDEVHRSQNGELNQETMELFETCSSVQTANDKRNLIIGLTATPTEEILAKYGEFKPSCSPSDKKIWVPYFSYTMRQAIDDKYILDPTKNIMTVVDTLEFTDLLGKGRVPSTKDVYGDSRRQELAAKEIVKIFVRETMNAIRPGRGRNSGRGEGKAIDVESSINVAIQMKPLIEEALIQEAQHVLDNIPETASKKTIENAYALSEAIKNVVVTLIFSDTATEKCSKYNDGLNEIGIIKKFRCDNSQYKNAIMIVVDKLLTGFDEPTLHTIFINKNMTDVSLFQAICRINRTYPNKNDCLVVDISHDITVAPEIPKVFKKYGEITISDFDAFTWQQKLNKAYTYLFASEKNKELFEQFKLWKTWNDTQKAELPTELLDSINKLFSGSEADLEKAITIWLNCSQWLNVYDKLKYLLDFSDISLKKHTSIEKQKFAELLRKTLYTKIQEAQDKDGKGGITFKIVKLENTYGALINSLSDEDEEEDKKPKEPKESDKKSNGTSSIDAIDILGMLQSHEEGKEKIILEVKKFMKALFLEIDDKSKENNNDSFRKKIKSGEDMSWE